MTKELEASFPATVKLKANEDGTWNAAVSRKTDGGSYPVVFLKNIKASECYARLGVKVPDTKVNPIEAEAGVREVLHSALKESSQRTVFTGTEVHDILLDALNQLGWAEDTTPKETE